MLMVHVFNMYLPVMWLPPAGRIDERITEGTS